MDVLIAEDDYFVGQMVRTLLEETGHRIVGDAVDGNEVVELVEKLEPDVVMMDVQMPGIDGIEATRRIQDRCPTPVVILTAYESPELVSRAVKAGVGAILVKPPQARALDRGIAVAVGRFQDMLTLKALNEQLSRRNDALHDALEQVKQLSGLLPMCAWCKKIRDDDGYWQEVEAYVCEHSEARFTHGICPGCRANMRTTPSKS